MDAKPVEERGDREPAIDRRSRRREAIRKIAAAAAAPAVIGAMTLANSRVARAE